MNQEIRDKMIANLQSMMDKVKRYEAKGVPTEFLEDRIDAMIACKEMVEAFIGEPVNLQKDGKVTVGF